MTNHLSFADRENLLETLRKLGGENVDVVFLLGRTGEWALAQQPQFGFEQALLRNLTQLADFLRLHEQSEDIASIARGAIRFIVADIEQPPELDEFENVEIADSVEFRALGKAFIASYAVHEIAARLGEPLAYHPPAITKPEQKLAEEIFEQLSLIEGCDIELVSQVKENLCDLDGLTRCGFLRRLANNAETLIRVLHDTNSSQDEKVCARGALRYFVKVEDAISDDLGLIGYLDDLFILQTAVDLVSPVREPLIELIDHVVGVWPFLNMLTLDDGAGPRAASEFTILNSALTCRSLRSSDQINAMLIAPDTGPIAILLGFVSTLGLAHEAGLRQLTEQSFNPGQKVLVDYQAVAFFEGFEDLTDGRRMFKLRKNRTERGVTGLGSINYWPMSDLHRLVPVDPTRATRGETQWRLRNKQTAVSGLHFLFNGPNKADVHAITKKVLVVMPTTVAADFCKSTLLYGQPIKDVIPVGQVSADGEETERWSTRFGTQEPVLLFASDLDVACSFAQDNQEDIELVIVDVAGRNREKHASIKRLNSRKIPCLLIATERTANETDVDQHNNLSVWEWGPEDLRALVWSDKHLPSSEIAKFESRVQATSSVKPFVEEINFPIVNETYKAFCSLRRLAKRRGPDGPPELEEIVSQGFFAITQLMRCSTVLRSESKSMLDITNRTSAMTRIMETSNYLSEDERSAATLVVDRIGEFGDQILQSNPKHVALQQILDKHPYIDLLCADSRLVAELERAFKHRRNRVFASAVTDSLFSNGLLVTGWFKKSRMASVLSPPIADPLILLLYDVERRWHHQFSEHRLAMREERKRLRGRKAIFPAIDGWKKPTVKVKVVEPDEPEIDNIEDISHDIDEGFRQRIYNQVSAGHSDADTKARLVLFAGGLYGLFTESYKLNVVTHVLDATIDADDEKTTVKLCRAKDVAVGDKIVFRPKSSDLIREVADELLEDGLREISGLWRVALRNYMTKYSVSDELMCSKLRAAGCKSQAQAIGNWIHDDDMIAPQQYRTDVPIIAEVTGDETLKGQINRVVEAIRRVRSAHQQKAPSVIAKRIRAKAAEVVRQEQADEPIVHLDGDLVLVRVAEKASKPIPVKYTAANRLMEGDSWHE